MKKIICHEFTANFAIIIIMHKFIYVTLLIVFLFPMTVKAEDKPEKTFFQNYIENDKEFEKLLILRSERVFRLTYPNCVESLRHFRAPQTILVEPVKREVAKIMIEDDNPDKDETGNQADKNTEDDEEIPIEVEHPAPLFGQWIERVHMKGCDEQILINHLTVAYSEEKPVILPLINGMTKLDPIDQPFAEKAIIARLQKLDKPCDSMPFIKNSQVIGYRTNDGNSIQKEDQGYGWFERWTIRACNTNYNANVLIMPDPKTRYRYIARLQQIENL
jgi:hypothetical protein